MTAMQMELNKNLSACVWAYLELWHWAGGLFFFALFLLAVGPVLSGWFLSRRPGNPARRSSSGAKSGDDFSERAEMLQQVLKVTCGGISVSPCQGTREENRWQTDRKSRHWECCAVKQHPHSQEGAFWGRSPQLTTTKRADKSKRQTARNEPSFSTQLLIKTHK